MSDEFAIRLEASVSPVLKEAGYEQVSGFSYKANWSSADVEHFVYLEEGAKTKGLYSGSFGIRNREAERFGVNAIRHYSSEFHFQALQYDERITCMMRCPFHRFKPPAWLLYVPHLTNLEMAKSLQHIITEHVRPLVGDITTIDRFLSFLVKYEPPYYWAWTNAAIRAAQIVVLASKSGLNSDQIRSILEPRLDVIAHGFHRSSPMRENPAAYVEGIVADWLGKPKKTP
jgi:hypothetical protein